MSNVLTAKQRDALNRFRKALKPFMELDGAMTLNRLETLLAVYVEQFDDMSQLRDYVDDTHGMSKSAMSRMVSWWSDEAYLQYKQDADGNLTVQDRPEGMGFLDIYPDPRDYRRRVIKVSEKGAEFGRNLADMVMENARQHFKEENMIDGKPD